MNAITISLIFFVCVFGGSLLGSLLRTRLPEHHVGPESKDGVRIAMALVSTMVGMSLGLLVGSAKSFYDTQNAEIAQLGANSVLLDRVLAHYGPDSAPAREVLRKAVASFSQLERPKAGGLPGGKSEALLDAIHELKPQTDAQRSLQNQALGIAFQIGQTRWLMLEQRTIPVPVILLGGMAFWLTALFVSFGLFAQRNGTVFAGFLFAGLAVSVAVFLIVEMFNPYGGLIQVSDAPLRAALAQLGT